MINQLLESNSQVALGQLTNKSQVSNSLGNDASDATKLSEGQMSEVRSAVRQCWNIDVGGRAQNVIVEIRVRYKANHQIEVLGIENEERAKSDPSFQAAAETARRAVLNPLCLSKWPDLPPHDYILRFNPSDMFGAG
jgi:hypothetical protein